MGPDPINNIVDHGTAFEISFVGFPFRAEVWTQINLHDRRAAAPLVDTKDIVFIVRDHEMPIIKGNGGGRIAAPGVGRDIGVLACGKARSGEQESDYADAI